MKTREETQIFNRVVFDTVKYIYHYWCYNPSTGTQLYPDSVELDIKASSEKEALGIAKKMVEDRGIYKLQTVSNLGETNNE